MARTAEDDKLVDFASSQIASLRMQRDAERRAHASTRQRVIELEAAVARRDAELDACVAAHTHLQATSSGPSGSSTNTKHSKIQAEPVVAFLDLNLITNRALEDELRALSRQVRLLRFHSRVHADGLCRLSGGRDGEKPGHLQLHPHHLPNTRYRRLPSYLYHPSNPRLTAVRRREKPRQRPRSPKRRT